ncbi:SLAM family member 9-like isoform X2 [Paramormyrops kingsleyae]|uniref:SLAM family member 9-like isoform X2 n=1 Tax=Paramormyrops kingsleyae TaxID=1676925 RepID=UPI003B96C05B
MQRHFARKNKKMRKISCASWLVKTYCQIFTVQWIMSLKCSSKSEAGYLLKLLMIPGLLGQEGKTVAITERLGSKVTLHTSITGLQNDSVIVWTFGTSSPPPTIAKSVNGRIEINMSERFRERLQLDPKTGSLSITNISTSDTGIYQLHIIKDHILKKEFDLNIYNPVNRPHITSLQASSPSSVQLSASGRCWVLCSVENGRDVTLSWYRGTERLNQTSSPDLSTSLSLSLEVWEDSPVYSCVATNPVSEEAAEGNIKQLCAELGSSLMPSMYIIPAIPAVLIPTAVMLMIGFICCTYNTKKFREIKASEGPPNSTLSVGVYIPAPVNPRSLLKQHSECTRAAAARDGDRGGQTPSETRDSLLTTITYTEGKHHRDIC